LYAQRQDKVLRKLLQAVAWIEFGARSRRGLSESRDLSEDHVLFQKKRKGTWPLEQFTTTNTVFFLAK